jgi:hypothetical protein
MKRAVFFILSIFREIVVKLAITLLVVAAIVGAAKVAVNYYWSNTCVSGFGTFNDACLEPDERPNRGRKISN